jgi:HK97 family phage prohead protease
MSAILKRSFTLTDLSLRAEGEDNAGHVEGIAAVYNTPSEDLYGYNEEMARGCFTKTLKEANVRALFNHDVNYVLGRSKMRHGKTPTLELRDTQEGLWFSALPPDAQWARDLAASMDRGDIDQCSFAFREVNGHWKTTEKGKLPTRVRDEVRLFDVSIVTYPAYTETEAQVRELRSLALEVGIESDPLTALLGIVRSAQAIRDGAPIDTNEWQEMLDHLRSVGPKDERTSEPSPTGHFEAARRELAAFGAAHGLK